MIRLSLSLPVSLAALALTAGPALATDIKIAEFIGEISVVEGKAGIEVIRAGKHNFERGQDGNDLYVFSDKDWNDIKSVCRNRPSLADYPKLRISVPKGSNLFIDQGFVDLDVRTDLDRADLQLGGCFQTRLRDVNALYLDQSGMGDVEIGDTKTLDIRKSGRGGIKVASASQLFLDKSGTDDVCIGPVAGPVTIDRSGTGLVEIASVSGDVRIEQSGSGDVTIKGGRVADLDVNVSGSGDIKIDAPVRNAVVSASGSSKVDLKSVSGTVRKDTSGSAKLRVAQN